MLLLVTARAPKPTAADVSARTTRTSMSATARRAFLCDWGFGIGALMLAYALWARRRSNRDV